MSTNLNIKSVIYCCISQSPVCVFLPQTSSCPPPASPTPSSAGPAPSPASSSRPPSDFPEASSLPPDVGARPTPPWRRRSWRRPEPSISVSVSRKAGRFRSLRNCYRIRTILREANLESLSVWAGRVPFRTSSGRRPRPTRCFRSWLRCIRESA